MKILMLFCDMLRTNLLHTVNEGVKENRVDRAIQKMGGTLYTKCYSPGPDTPRSMAALWSGQYPMKNGCNTRLRYPDPWLLNQEDSMLSVLEEAHYDFNFFINDACRNVGMLPPGFSKKGNHSKNVGLEEYLDELHIKDNSFTFLCLEDFHYAIDDLGANEDGAELGFELIGEAMELIDSSVGLSSFDVVIMLSDHGFKYAKDACNMDGYELLNSDRTQVFMLIKTKESKKLCLDSRICSVMDVYPTICDLLGEKNKNSIEGISLVGEKRHEVVLIEDHKTFTAEMGQTIEYWGVVNEKGYAVIGCDGNWNSSYPMKIEEEKKYEELLQEKMSFFSLNRKQYDILKLYEISVAPTEFYFNGRKRKKKVSKKQFLKNKIKIIIKKLLV